MVSAAPNMEKRKSFSLGDLLKVDVNWATIMLGASIFSSGAVGLVNEYVLSTVSTYILGNSILQFSIIIGLMLLMMGIGAAMQSRLKDTHLVEKFIAVEIALALIGSFAPIGIYSIFGYASELLLIALYGSAALIGFLIGFEIPIVLRINKRFSEELKSNVAVIFSMDYIGAFVGMLVWVTYLKSNFPLTEVSFIICGFNFAVMIATFFYFIKKKYVNLKKISIVAIILTSLICYWGYSSNRAWSVSLEQELFEDKIVYTATSKYQHLVITQNESINDTRLYINGNTQFSSLDEDIYHDNLVHPVMSLVPDHFKTLILGGGDGFAMREVLKYSDVESVVLVDLDPMMIEIASTNEYMTQLNENSFADARVHATSSGAAGSDGVRAVNYFTDEEDEGGDDEYQFVATVDVITMDAGMFVEEISEIFNTIIIDFPDPNSIELSKLYSKEFYQQLKSRLSERGMLVVQSTSPYHCKQVFFGIEATLQAAGFNTLPYHDNVPSFGDWGFILAWKSGESSESVMNRIQNFERFHVETDYLTPHVLSSNFAFGKNVLVPNPLVNTLMEPKLFDEYLKCWDTD